jgi:hypothetical protein
MSGRIRCHSARLLARIGPHAFRAVLPNAHELTAVVPRHRASILGDLAAGDEVSLDISPADFSRAMIGALVSRNCGNGRGPA